MSKEVWEGIAGYEEYYQVSTYGRIKSLARPIFNKDGSFQRNKSETIKTPKLSKDGYHMITLSVNGVDKTYPIHRLVAEAFIPKPWSDDALEVNHKDLNRTNNKVENLEWATHQSNVSYSAEQGRYKVHEGNKNGRCIPVDVYDANWNYICHFDFLRSCANWMIDNHYCRGTKTDSVLNGIKKSIDNHRPYFNFNIIFS